MAIVLTSQFEGSASTHVSMTNCHGVRVELVTLAASLFDWLTPLSDGRLVSIMQRPTQYADFCQTSMHYGRVIGRTAGRLFGNVIIDQTSYPQPLKGTIHGGKQGFSWAEFELFEYESTPMYDRVVFKKTIEHMEDGFPGTMTLHVTYTLDNDNRLTLDMRAICDADTLCNLTHHPYFNLSESATSIRHHHLCLPAVASVKVNEFFHVQGLQALTPMMDFNERRSLDTHWIEARLSPFKGYDNFWLRDVSQPIRLYDPDTTRELLIESDLPYCVVFTHNYPVTHPMMRQLSTYGGIAIECQGEPYALKPDGEYATLLSAGELYHHSITYRITGGGLTHE